MDKKTLKNLGKFIAVMAFVLSAMFICTGVRVRADEGKTIRVSTAKELKAAIKKTDVGTILFRTEAYLNVTINADKAAKGKSLIIDAKNSNITNKAVFSDINIFSAQMYTESVSGNRISLTNAYIPSGIIVSKKKNIKSLTIYDSQGVFYNNYTLRKNAKISELELIYSGDAKPVKSSYNKKKRQLALKCTSDGCERSYTIKLDKNGRMISIDVESNWAEADYDEAYTYDSNGNIVKSSGTENMSGKYSSVITYSGNLKQKSVYKDAYGSGVYTYTYDKDGNLVHDEYSGESSMDGQTYYDASIYDYKYDKKGRLIYERWENPESNYFTESSYTYNSKGFLTKEYINSSGSETVYKYQYDKAGNLIKKTYTTEGQNLTYTYEYDGLGVLKSEKTN